MATLRLQAVALESNNGCKAPENLWKAAFETLSKEDREQFKDPEAEIRIVLCQVLDATKSQIKLCEKKQWKVYKNRKGEDVKLRHVLEKISAWVDGSIKLGDSLASFDQSGHIALPWGAIKLILTTGFGDINLFSPITEGIESISNLLTRYSVMELLYLKKDYNAPLPLSESIIKLYAAILRYLAKAKSYFSGNGAKRFFHGVKDTLYMYKQYDELLNEISESEVDKWTKIADRELQLKIAKDSGKDYEQLRGVLLKLDSPIMLMAGQIAAIYDKFNKDERRRVFRWMSEVEYNSHHDNLSENLLPNSGQWLLTNPEFIQWEQSSVSSIFWLHGIGKEDLNHRPKIWLNSDAAGSGKTRLVSTVINHMREALSSESLVVFFYCSRSTAEPERAQPVEILGALLRQLAISEPDVQIRRPVAKEYESRKEKADQDCSQLKKLTVKDCVSLILQLNAERPAMIIIDALDECNNETRHELLEGLDTIISQSDNLVKVFVSSRDDVDIKLHLDRCTNISINASQNGEDISRFIKDQVDDLINRKLLLNGKVSSKFRDKICKTLNEGAQGMFRWVAMSLQRLQTIKYLPDFKAALGKLPSQLSELYDIVYAEIEQSGPYGRTAAISALTLLLCSQRLLSKYELIAAVYVQSVSEQRSSSEADSDSESDVVSDAESGSGAVSADDILQLCRNFVALDSTARVFRFAHPSVREYLLKLPGYLDVEQHARATKICLALYLMGTDSGRTEAYSIKKTGFEAFRPYARIYWPEHYKYVDDYVYSQRKEQVEHATIKEARTAVRQFLLEDIQKYVLWTDEFSVYQGHEGLYLNLDLGLDRKNRTGYRILSAAQSPPVPLNVVSAFGLSAFFREIPDHLLSSWISLPSDHDKTSLHLAAEEGHEAVVQLLLARDGVSSDRYDIGKRTPLSYAAEKGHETIVRLLLAREEVMANSRDCFGQTPLWYATWEGKEAVVRLLLNQDDIALNLHDEKNQTPLMHAAEKGHEAIVRHLLSRDDVAVNSHDEWGLTPLSHAVINGHEAAARLLLARDDVAADSHDKGGRTPLTYAAENGQEAVIQLLLARDDVAANSLDKFRRTPLTYAAGNGHEAAVRLLLARHNIAADLHDKVGRTPLSYAAGNGHEAVVQLLLARDDVSADRHNISKRTPLSYAAEKGHEAIVGLLLARDDVDADSHDMYNKTPLWHAARRRGNWVVVRLLLARDDVDSNSFFDEYPEYKELLEVDGS